jgi:hypothetical protein
LIGHKRPQRSQNLEGKGIIGKGMKPVLIPLPNIPLPILDHETHGLHESQVLPQKNTKLAET